VKPPSVQDESLFFTERTVVSPITALEAGRPAKPCRFVAPAIYGSLVLVPTRP
jgi:hypothetical protein